MSKRRSEAAAAEANSSSNETMSTFVSDNLLNMMRTKAQEQDPSKEQQPQRDLGEVEVCRELLVLNV